MVGLEPREGEGDSLDTLAVQVGHDIVPGPGTKPEARHQDDVGRDLGGGSAAHGAIVPRRAHPFSARGRENVGAAYAGV